MLVSIQFLLFLFRNQVIIFGVIGTSCWPNQFPNKLNKDFQVLPFYILVTHPILYMSTIFCGGGGWSRNIGQKWTENPQRVKNIRMQIVKSNSSLGEPKNGLLAIKMV